MEIGPMSFVAIVVALDQKLASSVQLTSPATNATQELFDFLPKLVATLSDAVVANQDIGTYQTVIPNSFPLASTQSKPRRTSRPYSHRERTSTNEGSSKQIKQENVEAERVYTVDEAERKYKISRASIYKLIGEGRLPDVKPEHGRRVIPHEAMEALFAPKSR